MDKKNPINGAIALTSTSQSREKKSDNSSQDFTFAEVDQARDEKINASLESITNTTDQIFKGLDALSNQIKRIESTLQASNVIFPYSYRLGEGEESDLKKPEERHGALSRDLKGYAIKICWYLVWDLDQISQRYRLMLVSEKKEILHYSHPEYYEDSIPREGETTLLTKKPFIESDLQTRVEYADKLESFLKRFAVSMRLYGFNLLRRNVPLDDDESVDDLPLDDKPF